MQRTRFDFCVKIILNGFLDIADFSDQFGRESAQGGVWQLVLRFVSYVDRLYFWKFMDCAEKLVHRKVLDGELLEMFELLLLRIFDFLANYG